MLIFCLVAFFSKVFLHWHCQDTSQITFPFPLCAYTIFFLGAQNIVLLMYFLFSSNQSFFSLPIIKILLHFFYGTGFFSVAILFVFEKNSEISYLLMTTAVWKFSSFLLSDVQLPRRMIYSRKFMQFLFSTASIATTSAMHILCPLQCRMDPSQSPLVESESWFSNCWQWNFPLFYFLIPSLIEYMTHCFTNLSLTFLA